MAYTIYSSVLTGLDAVPLVRPSAGAGASGRVKTQVGTVAIPTASAIGATAAAVRIPSNAMVKSVMLALDAAVTTLDLDVGLYFSDSPNDGTPVLDQGTVINATTFATGLAAAGIVEWQEIAFAGGAFKPSGVGYPIWQNAGYTQDTGGYYDIVLTVVTAATSGAANVTVKVEFDGGE